MKSKFLFIDLTICIVWMLSLFGGRINWNSPFFLLISVGVLLRFVVSFSLHRKEKRTWLPLGLFLVLAVLMGCMGYDFGVSIIARYSFILTGLEYSMVFRKVIEISLMLWLFAYPLAYYLYMLFRGQLERTDLAWKDLLGGILWHDRLTKTCSAILIVMLTAFLSGLSMNARVCQIMCMTAPPLTYWLICRYNKVKAEYVWILVISMCIFWYAQLTAGMWRAVLLFASFGFVVHIGIRLYRNTKNSILAFSAVLYLAMLLPSFSIGYNQYACLNYARKGFYYLSPFHGILYVTDSTRELYGLRDRYGLLVKPEYENISRSNRHFSGWRYVYNLQKDGKNNYYDVYNNMFLKHCQ